MGKNRKINLIINNILYIQYIILKEIQKLWKFFKKISLKIEIIIKIFLVILIILVILVILMSIFIKNNYPFLIKYIITEIIMISSILIPFIIYKIIIIKRWLNNNPIEKFLYFNTWNENIFYSLLEYFKTILFWSNNYDKYIKDEYPLDKFFFDKYSYYLDSKKFRKYLLSIGIDLKIQENLIINDNNPYKDEWVNFIIKNNQVKKDLDLFYINEKLKNKQINEILKNKDYYIDILNKSKLSISLKIWKYYIKFILLLIKFFIIGLIFISTYLILTDYKDNTFVKKSMICIKVNDKLEPAINCIFDKKESIDNINLIFKFLENNKNNEWKTYKDYINNTLFIWSSIIIFIWVFVFFYLPPVLILYFILNINKKKLIKYLNTL